ncbi:MAG: hypothetical protein JW820_14600 [Spirochaetales bacterium]|nr:hypothetical protein [Spirochaetales bacterium]
MITRPLTAEGWLGGEAEAWVKVEGRVFGCVPDPTGPIGGGDGYARAVVTGGYAAVSLERLLECLKKAGAGDTVYLPGNVVVDFTAAVSAESFVLHVPAGVTLASNRGIGGSLGALLKSDALDTSPLIRADGPGVRITGLRIQGPDPERRLDHWKVSFSSRYKEERGDLTEQQYYYSLPFARGLLTAFNDLEVDNCELWGWSHAAVFLAAGEGHHIHHNYIHRNQRQGPGYGVAHGTAFSVIEYNVVGWNRHSTAGTGKPPSGYIARHNLELGQSLSHNFDMHGGRDRKDGTNIAGSRIEIYSNTFLGRGRGVGIRGRADEYVRIHENWFVRHYAPGPAVFGWWLRPDTFELGENLYGAVNPLVE